MVQQRSETVRPGVNYRSFYASVGHSFRLLLLHDAWSRDTRVSDLYSLVANEEVPYFYFRYLNYRPGTATAQQELLASYDYFAKQGQALLNARIDRDMRCGGFNASCKIGEDELAFGKGHFNSMAPRVCKILGQPEDQPLSQIRVSDGNAGEDAGQIAFTVTLDPAPVETVEVQWRTFERSSPGRRAATVDVDYPWTRGTVRFHAGETSKQFTVEIVDDAVKEPPEGFSVQLWRVIGDAVRVDGLAEATIDGELEPSTATPGSPRITSASGLTVVEGDTGVARLTAYDRDTPAADLQWSVPSGTGGGADGGKFGITSAGVLAFAAAKDYEAPDDADTDGIYEVTVQVSDGVRSDTADLTVTLLNRNEAPTAEAGADQSAIEAGATVTLAGSGTDPDAGDELAYAWTQTGGAAVTVSDAAVATPTFTAPTGLTEDATLNFRLRVTDKAGLYHEDAVSITVRGAPPPPPVATIAAVATPVTEGTAAAFTVTLDRAALEALTVPVTVTESGSMLSGSAPQSVTFTAGATSATLSLPTVGDSVVEADSTVTATVTAGTGYTVGTASSASVTVEDDDVVTFTVSAEPEALSEGESATLTVAIANEVTFAEAQTISLATSGTASASDYADVPTTLTLPAGASSVTATLTATADQEDEEAETVTVTASHGGSSIGSATVTINSISHDATLGTLSLSGIDIGTFSGEVTAYTASVANAVTAATVTATAAHSAATVAIEPDPQVALAEGTNEISVTVTAEDGTTTKTYTVTVTRAALPVATIAAGTTPVTEGTAATYTVTLDPAAPEALTVTVSVVETGAVLSGTPPASVSFAKGATSATLSVPTAADSIVEADSTVTATVTVGTGYTVGPGASAPVTVEDDDAAAFTVSADAEAIREGESATLTMAIANGVSFAEAQTISLTTSGTASAADYTGVPETLELAAGQASVTVTLAASADQEDEEAETVTVTASHGGSAIGSATVTINSVSHDAALASLSLSGIDIGTFSGAETSYQASVANSVTATTVTATAAHSAATVAIDPGPQLPLAEGANEITVTVTAEDGTTKKTYTVTVTRAALPVVTIAAGTTPVTEGTAASFTVTLDQAAPEALTVAVSVAESGSALAGTPPASISFAKGATSATLSVPTAADSIVEADSTVTSTVTVGTGYAIGTGASALVTVEDDDAATFAVSAEPEAISEGESATVTVAIANGVTFAEAQTISLATSGTATPSDYTDVPATLTLAAGASSVTATLAAAADQEEEEAETVTVTASHGGSAIGSATVTISSISHDATLASLSLSGIDIGTFSGAATSYQASVSHSVRTTTVTATASHSAATVSIEPGPEVALAEGANQVTVRVRAEDGTTTKSYTVTVTRASLPVVSIAAVEERLLGPIGEFTLSRTGPAAEPLEVQVLFTSSQSQVARPVTVRFRAVQASVTKRVQGGDNRLVEDDITMTWTLQEGEGYTLSAEHASASLVLEESDIPEFAVSAEPAEIAEGESATVTVAITNGVRFAEDQTIALAMSGTASASDFTGVPERLTLAARASSVTATLQAVADQVEEEAETVMITASHGGSAIGSATVTISSISHDATLASLSLSGIDIGTFSGAATSYQASVSHSVKTTTVTATASHSAATVSIEPGPEVALAEGANQVTVRVTAEDGTTKKTYTVTVTRASQPVVSIVAVQERLLGPIGEFMLSRTGPTTEPLEVQVLFTSSRSQAARPVTARFRAGQASVTRRVQGGDNRLVEDDITMTWTLQEGEGYTLSAEQASASLVLEESEIPEFALSVAPAEIAEGESATVTVEITNGVRFAEDQTITLEVAGGTADSGTDFTLSSQSLRLRRKTSSATATLEALGDEGGEGDETVSVTARHGGEAIGTQTVTITDSSAAALTAEFQSMPKTHDGLAAFPFELRFSEEIAISYETLRDSAFVVTGGSVTGARRLVSGSNRRWEVTVQPTSDADVVLRLPVTAHCAAAGAVCTQGGKPLSESLQATVKGPGSAAAGFPLTRENSRPSGIWSDGETAWVADLDDARLYAYRRADGEPQPGKDIATEPAPMGLWSDGETLWVAGLGGGLRAHRLADGSRQAWRDLALEANAAPAGVWSDGKTAWVADWLGETVHAYRLEDGKRLAGRDIKLAGENLMPVGVWSDGETLWVADWRERMFAYRLSDGRREPGRDVVAGSADTDPSGLWSDGETLLSTSWEDSPVRAYRLPGPLSPGPAPGKSSSVGLPARAASLPPIADSALRAAIGAALGKTPGEAVSPEELAGLESLEARHSGIRDLVGLERAVGLKDLDLGFNPLADLGPLAALPRLESLNLDGAVLDLQMLTSLRTLKRLSVRNNVIDDLQPLAALVGLTELDAGDNRIADLSPLTGLTRLTVLRADRNHIADLWPLASLAGLEALELGANRVRDLQPLAGLTQLRSLRLEGNGLAELYPLAWLDGLRDLGLAGNAVESVRALADLGGLRRLDLRGNAVEDLRPLSALGSLVWVHVGGSQIKDLAPLDNLSGLTVAGREDRDSPSAAVEGDAQARRQ